MRRFNDTVLRTLAYGDIFDYPLTAEEIKKYAIAPIQSIELPPKQKYFFLPGREKLVQIRKQREKWSRQKLRLARRAAGWLKMIPWIKMTAVTGALAMNNADKGDDLDLLIITAKNRLWLTRLLAVLLIEVTGQRRRPGDKHFANKICLNMFWSQDALAVPLKERNLYTAHEVAQVKKIWDKDDVYQKFLAANAWVEKYLPNAVTAKKFKGSNVQGFNNKNLILDWLEGAVKWGQWQYMKNKITREKISAARLMFHPRDMSRPVLREYQKHLDKFLKDSYNSTCLKRRKR
ncbi:MAG: hypothetical protein ABH807_01800 [Candidatus Shapirobacteria bacterium]